MASLVGSRISACGSNGLASRQCFSVGRALSRRHFDIVLAGGVQTLGIPAQRLRFLDRALHVVAQRARPVDGELRAQFMPDIDRVPHPERRVLPHLGRFRRGPAGQHRMDRRFRS